MDDDFGQTDLPSRGETQGDLQQVKLKNVHDWVQHQALDIPPPSLTASSQSSQATKTVQFSDTGSGEKESTSADSGICESKSASSSSLSDSSPESFDFEKFPSRSHVDGSSSTCSFLTVNENLPKDAASNSLLSNRDSQFSDFGSDVLHRVNQRLTELGYGSIDKRHEGEELASHLGNKLLAVLTDVRRKNEISKELVDDSRGWKSKEQSYMATIRSLELRLEERDRKGQSIDQVQFREKERTDNTIKALQEQKRLLEIERNKLSNCCNALQHKQNDLNRGLEAVKMQLKTQEKERQNLKERIRALTEQEKQHEKRKDEDQKHIRTLENTLRLRDRDLSALQTMHEKDTREQEKTLERQSQLEKALRDHEKENFQLKQIMNSGTRSQESKKALTSAADEIKCLKEDLSMERSRRDSSERKCEKLGMELKKAQEAVKDHEKSLRQKETTVFEMDMEIKRLKLERDMNCTEETKKDPDRKTQECKRQNEKLQSENRDLNQSVKELTQRYKFLQKENLQLDAKRLQAEKKVQNCNSEIARLTDDLAEKDMGLKESTKRLSEAEQSLASSESHVALQSENAKGKEVEHISLQKTHSNLLAQKCSLEHKIAQLEATCAGLRDRLKEKIAKEEKRVLHEKEAYRRLKNATKRDQNTRGDVHRGLVFHFCEKKIQELTSEAEQLHEQQRSDAKQLKALENELVGFRRAESASAAPDEKIKNRLRLAEKSITDLTTKLMTMRESESDELRHFKAEKKNLEQRIAEQNQIIHKLQERLLEPCPELRHAQKQIKALKNKIKQQQPKQTTAIQSQDKQRSLMHLNAVSGHHTMNRLPRPQIEKILKSLCVMLEIQDPSSLVERICKLLRVVRSLPKVQKFVSEVCDIVLCKGAPFVPIHLRPPSSRMPEEGDVSVLVPAILRYWVDQFS